MLLAGHKLGFIDFNNPIVKVMMGAKYLIKEALNVLTLGQLSFGLLNWGEKGEYGCEIEMNLILKDLQDIENKLDITEKVDDICTLVKSSKPFYLSVDYYVAKVRSCNFKFTKSNGCKSIFLAAAEAMDKKARDLEIKVRTIQLKDSQLSEIQFLKNEIDFDTKAVIKLSKWYAIFTGVVSGIITLPFHIVYLIAAYSFENWGYRVMINH